MFNVFKCLSHAHKDKKYLADCGHKCKKTDQVSAFGETTETTVPIVNGKVEYCHKCLEKMAIRCPWCGRPIFIGDRITLYTPVETFKIPDWAIKYQDDPIIKLVGCSRRNCAHSGADLCGYWAPPGEVYRQASGIELALANPGCIIIGNHKNGKDTFEIIKH